MLNFYKISIDPNDDTGMYYNSLVDVPAHMKMFDAYGKQAVRYEFNEEKRIVTGVFISVGTPIERRDEIFGHHYVVFDEKNTTLIKEKFHRLGFNNRVNEMHDPKRVKDGIYLIESYQIGLKNSPGIPEKFKGQNLQPGSWLGSYKIDNPGTWERVKKGEFQGFSIEGEFYKDLIKIKTKEQMNKKTKTGKTIFQMLFGSKNPEKFAEATTTDGVILMYEGELGEGAAVFIEADGEQIPAPAGPHQVTLEDGSVKVIEIDAAGLVTKVSAPEEPEADEEGLRAEVVEAMIGLTKDTHDRLTKIESDFAALKKENADLKADIEKMKAAEPEKFSKQDPKKVDGKKMTVSEIMAVQKK